ncbi:hypothetical protein KKH56_04020 [bacterium]|nr:hypothetical protein [bacterium]
MAIGVSKSTLKVLTDLTGEIVFERALNITLKDSIEHRLEKIKKNLNTYQKNYGMKFDDFKMLWSSGKIKNQSSYEVEKDFLEWEGLVMRKDKLEGISKWFI